MLEKVTLETAKIAKMIGFDQPCYYATDDKDQDVHAAFDLFGEPYFYPEDIKNADSNADDRLHYLLPFQAQLQTWLRDKHNVIAEVNSRYSAKRSRIEYVGILNGEFGYDDELSCLEDNVTAYEDCLEVTLIYAMGLIYTHKVLPSEGFNKQD